MMNLKLRILGVLALLIMVNNMNNFAGEKSKLVVNLELGKQQTVITYGTSLTAGGAWVQEFQQILNKNYPSKANVINSGKGSMWSKWGVDNLDKLVVEKKPDTVFIEFAINDAYLPYKMTVEQARNNLENMIDRILKSNVDCEIVIMTMNPPVGEHLINRPKVMEYYQMYRDVAKERKVILIDHYPNWEKVQKENPELFKKYIPDGIHPAAEGCQKVITPEIVKSLGIKNGELKTTEKK